MKKRILVAVDETEASRRAAAFVDGFFHGDDAEIVAVNVARLPVMWMPAAPYGGVYTWPTPTTRDRSELDEEYARSEAEATAVATQQAPRDAEVEVVFGDAVEAIETAADDHDADLIVVGSNDKSFLQRLLGGGSVSQRVAREANRPVLIVP